MQPLKKAKAKLYYSHNWTITQRRLDAFDAYMSRSDRRRRIREAMVVVLFCALGLAAMYLLLTFRHWPSGS